MKTTKREGNTKKHGKTKNTFLSIRHHRVIKS